MAKVRVTSTVRIGSTVQAVKKVPSIAPILKKAQVEATTTQLRVMAEEAREMLLDKLFAATPQRPGLAVVDRPPHLRASPPGVARSAFRHRKLRLWYVRRKRRLGRDGRILIALGDYARGIEVFKGQQASGVYYMVRPEQRPHDAPDDQDRIMLSTLAKVHEFGSARAHIPPRPHWRPTTRAVISLFERQRRTVRAAILRQLLREVS